MRLNRGSSRKSGGSFLDDKMDSALTLISQDGAQSMLKSMMPLGGFRQNMNPATAIDADNDLLVLEGIPTVNFGRGVPDPTPGVKPPPPLNRRVRRETRAAMGKPSRISRVGRNYLRYASASDGPFGSMSSAMSSGYPRSRYAAVIPHEKSQEWINSVQARVDSVLGPKPKTMKELLRNLKSAEEFVNSSKDTGRNFTIKPVYFLAQTQDELARALGGRFAGMGTTPSQHDLGLYYVLADHMLSYPESFENVNLTVLPLNMPDVPVSDGTGGAALTIPSYFSAKLSGGRKERRINMGGREVEMESSTGVRDFSIQPELKIEPQTSGGQLQSMLMFPVYGDPNSRMAKFTSQGNTVEIDSTQGRFTSLKKILERFEQNNNDDYPLVDTVSLNIMLGFMDKMRELEQLKERVTVEGADTPGAIAAIDAEILSLLNDAEIASSASIAVHEMGHYLDKIGDYRMSRAHRSAVSQSSRGLNSTLEYQRDMAELMRLKEGESSEILDDVAYALSQDWTKKTLSNMLSSVVIADMAADVSAELSSVIDQLTDITRDVRSFARDGGQVLDEWYSRVSLGVGYSLQNSLINLNSANVVRMPPGTDPLAIEDAAKAAIARMAGLTASDSFIAKHPYLGSLPQMLRHMTKTDNFDALAEGASPSARAMIYASAAEGMRKQVTRAINQLTTTYGTVLQEAEKQVDRLAPVIRWINDQTIDMYGYRQGWRHLITDLVNGNPEAIEQFMQISSDLFRKDAWVDSSGNFNKRRYLMDVLAGVDEQGGAAKGFGSQISALFAINRAFNMKENNGWKNLPDDQIGLIQDSTNGISEYAGPADYTLEAPKPKMQLASNAETYAELHAALSMDIAETIDRLNDDEIEAIKRLREEMIKAARGMMETMGESVGDE